MTLYNIQNGTATDADEVMGNILSVHRYSMLDHIRTLMDRTLTYSKGYYDLFADAYISTTSRMGYVSFGYGTSYTTAVYLDSKYVYPSNITSLSWSTTANSTTNNTVGVAIRPINGTITNLELTKHGSVVSTGARVYIAGGAMVSSGTWSGNTCSLSNLSLVAGSNYTVVAVHAAGTATYYRSSSPYTYGALGTENFMIYEGAIGNTPSGANSTLWDITTLRATFDFSDGIHIKHTIPAGRLSPSISSAILVTHIGNWTEGADIQYKLTNTTEDTGWLSCGNNPSISSFTAFTSEPTMLTVKLIAASTETSAFSPGLYGVALRAE